MHDARRRELERWESEGKRSDLHLDGLTSRIERAKAAARARRGQAVPESLRLTALHEAAHAVVALALGDAVTGVLVDPDGRSGVTWLAPGHGGGAAAMAGAVAEQFAGHGGAQPSPSDLRLAPAGSARSLVTFDAEEILAHNYERVEALAGALIRLGYVDGTHVEAHVGRPRLPATGVV